jgi:hypothetical protein
MNCFRSRAYADLFIGAIIMAFGTCAFQKGVAAVPEKVRFNEQVRPILSTCFFCHGPDEKHREAKLRLDVRESAVAKGAIVPGKPDESELLARVISQDADDVMPPPKAKKPLLTKDEIAVLRRWIEQGAEYEGHWAFQPLRDEAPPAVKDTKWCRTPVDHFIIARLEREGIAPSAEADRPTLLRRVTLDLTGLLPSLEEMDAFIHDKSPKAYENVVNRLLASEHYGERWGRHWLDQARYADSNGYSIDNARAMWPYRDWVIAALNADMPFDRFTIDQLAGDLLPNATKSQHVATGFHRNTLINEEGGVDAEQMRIEAAMDRTATTGTVWLGLTVGCAQCHTHKFDPIPHREYYQLYAFFNSGSDVNNRGATVPVSRGEMFGKPAPDVLADDPERARRQAAWEKAELAKLSNATPATSPGSAKWTQRTTWNTIQRATPAFVCSMTTHCSATGAAVFMIHIACSPAPRSSASPPCVCACSRMMRCPIMDPAWRRTGTSCSRSSR